MSVSGHSGDDNASVFSATSTATAPARYSFLPDDAHGENTMTRMTADELLSLDENEQLQIRPASNHYSDSPQYVQAWIDNTDAASQGSTTIHDLASDYDTQEEVSSTAKSNAWRKMLSLMSSVDFWLGVGACTLIPEAAPAILDVVNAALKAGGTRVRQHLLGKTEGEITADLVREVFRKGASRVSRWNAEELSRAFLQESRRESGSLKGLKEKKSWMGSFTSRIPFT